MSKPANNTEPVPTPGLDLRHRFGIRAVRGKIRHMEIFELSVRDFNTLVDEVEAEHQRICASERLDTEEMTLRYAIQTLEDTDKEFALENLQRQLDKNLRASELQTQLEEGRGRCSYENNKNNSLRKDK